MGVPAVRIIDGNEAAASVAYRLIDVAAIYPITPSTPMGELADEWASKGLNNIWGRTPRIAEMQSEGGAAGAVHGAATAGALAATFTASQGLLLMIPNMYKLAGELTPFVMHVAARTLATHALSIFGDHSDVLACRQTGFAMLASNSPQEAHDLACIAHAASLETRLPFMHFFDGFRTSHELRNVSMLTDDDLRAMIVPQSIADHQAQGLSPDTPAIRGTAQNPDAYFQAREACNPFYDATPDAVEAIMRRFEQRTGRAYTLFEYHGHPEAERVIVLMGSGAETAAETAERLTAEGERVGVIAVRLYRPFSIGHFAKALPATVRSIAVLDRTKEPGATAEPLYQDVITALGELAAAGTLPTEGMPRVVGGRFGLSGKEFTPKMVRRVFAELGRADPKRRFTVGITDDVTGLSLDLEGPADPEPDDVLRAVFYGLGSDGTVGANKNTIKIIGEAAGKQVHGYFVYDSKKSGSWTVSHLRFADRPIRSSYLIESAQFVACHQFNFLDNRDLLEIAADGATVLLNSPSAPGEVWDELNRETQEQIISKNLRVFVIDADSVAAQAGVGRRINTIMQTCFFAISGVLPREDAIAHIKDTIEKTYGKKGNEVVRRNIAAVDAALDHLHEMPKPTGVTATRLMPPIVPDAAPDFVKQVSGLMMQGKGDLLPVGAFPPDGTWPTGTAKWERRSIATRIPVWEPELCIECNRCTLVCPHAAIRAKAYDPEGRRDLLDSIDMKGKDLKGTQFTIQVAPDDCTGCNLCVNVCPAKDKTNPRRKAINMEPKRPILDRERARFEAFLGLPQIERTRVTRVDVKGSQLMLPLFEYSGACAGCGETPYIKLLTQLFGDRLLIANATGCSSIYCGNLPTTPFTTDANGRGPAWSNSLFEDNAEFGFGMRLAVDALATRAAGLLDSNRDLLPGVDVDAILAAQQHSEGYLREQRARVAQIRDALAGADSPGARELARLADYLVRKSVWLVGGDGWAFDIGYGGLDHVLASGANINALVLDTEVYSNTGGQASKATPIGAAAKFAASGKSSDKKDLGLMAMQYGHVYVASIAIGAKDTHTVTVLQEAEAHPGPSLVIAYSPCIAHGYDLQHGVDQQKKAVECGIWPLYRYDPRRAEQGQAPLVIDAPAGKIPVREYMQNETRFRIVERQDPERFRLFAAQAQHAADRRIAIYKHMASLRLDPDTTACTADGECPIEPEPASKSGTPGTEAIHE